MVGPIYQFVKAHFGSGAGGVAVQTRRATLRAMADLIDTIRDGIIGSDNVIDGAYGARRVTYADYTASGRALSFVEDFMRHEVLPLYANTHTETSGTGLQTTRFREDARKIILDAVGGSEDDVVVFCGSGATGAINKLVDVLNLRIPANLDSKYDLSAQIPADQRPVVFIGPYEHHSNELPWRESIADVVTIDEDHNGRVDAQHLEEALLKYADRPLKIGSFSAASNVTGIGSDTRNISVLLHKHGALSLWDFAAAAPYVKIEMNMRDDKPDGDLAYKDAIFISPHKFIGGPGTPGLLIAKRRLFTNKVPTSPGGGTVAYVNTVEHRYLDDIVHREEGGTPAILGSIRAGLVFQLKEAVGYERIHQREKNYVDRAIAAWSKPESNVSILGNTDAWRLSIVSFMVRHGQGFLHHNYVVALLNDLLGIQARGGCSCAGPYGHRLLGIDLTRSKEFEREVIRGCEGVKPGWVRVNFNYFISETIFDYLVEAVELVATEGWKLLPHYRFEPETGLWTHRGGLHKAASRLTDLTYRSGRLEYRSRHATEPEWTLPAYLAEAREIITQATEEAAGLAPITEAETSDDFEHLRWFPLPNEILEELQGSACPLTPGPLLRSKSDKNDP